MKRKGRNHGTMLAGVTMTAILMILGLQTLGAQQSLGTFSYDVPCTLLIGGVGIPLVLNSTVHFVVQARVDENGCMEYTISHNWANTTITSVKAVDDKWLYKSCSYNTGSATKVVCDNEECLITFYLEGSMDLNHRGSDTTLPDDVIWNYQVPITWNRCTGEFTFPPII